MLLLIACLLGGCATTPPSRPDDLCAIFSEKPRWHKDALKASRRYGSSIPVMMSIMYQESRFVSDAQPPFRWFLFIPRDRASSAYGYPQAKDETWDWYQNQSGHSFASRSSFADSIDFIGWYNAQTERRNGVRRNDAYHLYLAYHEGHGGFQRRSFSRKSWLKNTARTVSARSANYNRQYQRCKP
ncbi:Conserved hypothetical lipoprotein [gamma proteobacterium HdN1]|nr:Conserved hypothetical lipoprotein [gamma proteobacterium HdN1]